MLINYRFPTGEEVLLDMFISAQKEDIIQVELRTHGHIFGGTAHLTDPVGVEELPEIATLVESVLQGLGEVDYETFIETPAIGIAVKREGGRLIDEH